MKPVAIVGFALFLAWGAHSASAQDGRPVDLSQGGGLVVSIPSQGTVTIPGGGIPLPDGQRFVTVEIPFPGKTVHVDPNRKKFSTKRRRQK